LAAVLGLALCALGTPSPAPAQPAPPALQAAQIVDGVAPVGPANSIFNPELGLIDVLLLPDPVAAHQPVVSDRFTTPAALLVEEWASRGRAAGLGSVIYDNRDGGHSRVRQRDFPQLAATNYSEVFKAEGLHYGAAGALRFSLPTIGNSSTALTKGPLRRSQARFALGSQAQAMRVWALYAANHLYVYPEHRDHDPRTGDRLFANTPYLVVTQGSSGSDRPLMTALMLATAALPKQTQERLISEGLLAATLQMLLRRTYSGSELAYLSGAGQPSVFDGEKLDQVALVSAANALSASEIPPIVKLTVEEDFAAIPGVDYLARNLSEEVFTTPSAIARAWRSYDHGRTMQISVAATQDPNGRQLAFRWVVLRGDPDKITITPLDGTGSRASIRIDWHDAMDIVPAQDDEPALKSYRVDIGIFADNGATLSAPAIVSVAFPVFQRRVYQTGADGLTRLTELTLDGDPLSRDIESYADPVIWPTAPWSDRLSYDSQGQILRIDRHYTDRDRSPDVMMPGLTSPVRMTADGRKVPVWHVATRDATGGLSLHPQDPGETASTGTGMPQ
jgi:hypothetical protein